MTRTKGERRASGRDAQVLNLAQSIEDFLRQAIAEELVLFVGAQIGEREHRDGRHVTENRRITFHVNGKFGAQEPTRAEEVGGSNLYLEGFTILIQANVADEDHLMTLDTGATGTFMSEQYYQQHRQGLNAEDLRELELVGVGGSTVIPAYLQHNVRFGMGVACVVLDNLIVLTEPTGLPDEFWGNVGQSTVRLFGSYTLDFRTMTLSAEGQVMTGKDIYGCAVR